MSMFALVLAFAFSVVSDVCYDDSHQKDCVGDLYLPGQVLPSTPMVVVIHGGGWSGMDRSATKGIADYFAKDLGFAAFNIEYRLASGKNQWPACGNDCVAAANFVLSDDFKSKYGFAYDKVWICGESAGGHLALWTGLTLPSEKVAGIVSISGIGDPLPDAQCDSGRYRALFGGVDPTAELYDSMNPLKLIRPNGPKVLCTHATGDKVVPIESAKNFSAAYRAAGNEIEFYEYSNEVECGLTGHCIWRPESDSHRLISALERTIGDFVLPARVPEPKPLKTDIEVHAFYYPGTDCRWEWYRLEKTLPKIKPLLGWYDETDPEVVDWQIKWAVEHGISAFCVDWYWHRGDQRLDHWIKAYYRAKHRRYLKWYMMYANHNLPGAHDEADTRRLVRFWIENYFRTPEYYCIDGKPVVVLWAYDRFGEDFAELAAKRGEKITVEEGLRRAIELMQSIVREAGLPGIHFIDMYHSRKYEQHLVDVPRTAGYAGQMIYNFDTIAWDLAPEARKADDVKYCFDYALIRPAVNRWWEMTSRDPKFPFWPIVPTGWNDQPRSFLKARIIRNRTPEEFRAILDDCRRFCERRGFKRCILAPINEWQEGSYIEPNEEYGFAMYDAIREVFCKKPDGGWPKNVVPSDVGCGPYDFPEVARPAETAWDFADGVEGWNRNPSYATAYVRNREGSLYYFRGVRELPAACKLVAPFDAQSHSRLSFRAKVLPSQHVGPNRHPGRKRGGCLMWGTTDQPIIRVDSAKGEVSTTTENLLALDIRADGQWHDYTIDLSKVPGWKGMVDEIWFDADNFVYSEVWIDRIEFMKVR